MNTSAQTSAEAIQIVTPVKHSFELNLNDLERFSNNCDIKSRHVVVVSIAGAYRKGKSFLLNFFLKFLNAKYKRHDVSDWLGEKSVTSILCGFQWRGGKQPETTGIWMWSKIFTHDFDNGEKVAIVLLDTQGIFDHRSSKRDCAATFALSMLLSSVQCYNVMQNIQEDDLENLDLFTGYGRLVLEQSGERPFQKLLFIVRDWPHANETGFGWSGQKEIKEILADDHDHTAEMKQLRKRIKSSIEEVSAFLMPCPGEMVREGTSNGSLQQIDHKFKEYVKVLVPSLFAPENLIVKKINGQPVQVGELFSYLQAYAKVVNGKSLPDPQSLLIATANVNNSILYEKCMDFYITSMQKYLDESESYYSEAELNNLHQNSKVNAIQMFVKTPKLGGDELSSSFLEKIENGTEGKFLSFCRENDIKRNDHIEKMKEMEDIFRNKENRLDSLDKNNMQTDLWEEKRRFIEQEAAVSHNNCLRSELTATFQNRIYMQIADKFHTDFDELFSDSKATMLQNFDSRQKGDSDQVRAHFEQDLESLKFMLKRLNDSNKLREMLKEKEKPRDDSCTIL